MLNLNGFCRIDSGRKVNYINLYFIYRKYLHETMNGKGENPKQGRNQACDAHG